MTHSSHRIDLAASVRRSLLKKKFSFTFYFSIFFSHFLAFFTHNFFFFVSRLLSLLRLGVPPSPICLRLRPLRRSRPIRPVPILSRLSFLLKKRMSDFCEKKIVIKQFLKCENIYEPQKCDKQFVKFKLLTIKTSETWHPSQGPLPSHLDTMACPEESHAKHCQKKSTTTILRLQNMRNTTKSRACNRELEGIFETQRNDQSWIEKSQELKKLKNSVCFA